jgi:hypothetical protein
MHPRRQKAKDRPEHIEGVFSMQAGKGEMRRSKTMHAVHQNQQQARWISPGYRRDGFDDVCLGGACACCTKRQAVQNCSFPSLRRLPPKQGQV